MNLQKKIQELKDAGKKLRGIGFTRKSKEETKKARKLARTQRKINHKRANKKFRKTGSKNRK